MAGPQGRMAKLVKASVSQIEDSGFESQCDYHSGCGAVGSARRLGRRGRWFKSSHPDHMEDELRGSQHRLLSGWQS